MGKCGGRRLYRQNEKRVSISEGWAEGKRKAICRALVRREGAWTQTPSSRFHNSYGLTSPQSILDSPFCELRPHAVGVYWPAQ
jgi:hypothetical protein